MTQVLNKKEKGIKTKVSSTPTTPDLPAVLSVEDSTLLKSLENMDVNSKAIAITQYHYHLIVNFITRQEVQTGYPTFVGNKKDYY